jgi:hypothetical protein
MFHAQFYYQTHRSKLIIVDTDNAFEMYHIFTPIHVNFRFIASSRKPIIRSLYWTREIQSTSSNVTYTMIRFALMIFFYFGLPAFLIKFCMHSLPLPCPVHFILLHFIVLINEGIQIVKFTSFPHSSYFLSLTFQYTFRHLFLT